MNLTITASQLKHIIKVHFKSVYPDEDFSKHEIYVDENEPPPEPGQLFGPGCFNQKYITVDFFIPDEASPDNKESL